MSDLAYRAMMFAHEKHKHQRRRYTDTPYTDHLAEVAGIVASILPYQEAIAIAWLHDTREDTDTTEIELWDRFGEYVAKGVEYLTDSTTGNRATRKGIDRTRLFNAPEWVQTVKVADIISNTGSIIRHDPNFARVYVPEVRLMLGVLTKADRRLLQWAREGVEGWEG